MAKTSTSQDGASGVDPVPPSRCRCGYSLFAGQRCPECGRSFEDATTPDPVSRRWIASLSALLLVVMIGPSFSCACGHLDGIALVFTSPTFALAWWPFLTARESRLVPRALAVVAVIAATMLWLKNVCDVLWLGHDPLLV